MYGDNHGLVIMENRFGSTLVERIPNSNCSHYECGMFNTCQISFVDEDAWSIDESGRFQVKLPWEFVRSNLRDSRKQKTKEN